MVLTPHIPSRLTWFALGQWPRRHPSKGLLVPLLVVILIYGLWPYATLWRLHQAVRQDDRVTLAALVDLPAIREELARRLNKEHTSAIGALSDDFIHWLEHGIRRSGTAALDELVTLDWVRERLLAGTFGQTYSRVLSRAFFDSPWTFRVRLDQRDAAPSVLRLSWDGLGWRMTMFYF